MRWHLKSNVPEDLHLKYNSVTKPKINRHSAALNDVSGFSNEHGYITSIAVMNERSTSSSGVSSRPGRRISARIRTSPPMEDIRRMAYLAERSLLLILRS